MATKSKTAVATAAAPIITADGEAFSVGSKVFVVSTRTDYSPSFNVQTVEVIAIDAKQRLVHLRRSNGKEFTYDAEGLGTNTEVYARRTSAVDRVKPIAEKVIANADAEVSKKSDYAKAVRAQWEAVRRNKPVPTAQSDD